MSSLTVAALLSVAGLGPVWNDYSAAYASAVRENRELLVLITADWCGPCRRLKRQVLPSAQLQPVLQSYVCAMIDVDRQPELARALGGTGGVPLLIAYNRTELGWVRREIRGYQSVEKLKRFLHTTPRPEIRQTAGEEAEIGESRSDADSPGISGGYAEAPEPKTSKPSRETVQLLGIIPEGPTPLVARKQTPRRTGPLGSTRR